MTQELDTDEPVELTTCVLNVNDSGSTLTRWYISEYSCVYIYIVKYISIYVYTTYIYIYVYIYI